MRAVRPDPASPDTLHLVTLNIQHGGGTRMGKIIDLVLGWDADVLVLTEFRLGTAAELLQRLGTARYAVSHPPGVDPTRNSVLIASRHGFTDERRFAEGLDPRHLWCAVTAGISLCAAYLPVPTELRTPYLQALAATGRNEGIELILGDFNTGKNGPDTTVTRGAFPWGHLLDRLATAGYTDLWRDRHPEAREYSYYSWKNNQPYNGFRIDYAFATDALKRRVVGCSFEHPLRYPERITDHSALHVWIASGTDA